ncbi:hypothetical protein [Paraburkholderia susongensis]|uniref:Uncharacterized protein n=1 Tax=Paraburkholderia susongensis TaxID=1515439 RepID=A0A1X7I5R5_9BURK|nr:hypothetical protein [Paraburkholderia susongensis]SMG09830.1 hypothetical protein SAMN06265784_101350 [Paraburkholderia susongensis]
MTVVISQPPAVKVSFFATGPAAPVVTLGSDGSVELGPDVDFDQAACALWDAVRRTFDAHATPPSDVELRAIHADAVACVVREDRRLTPADDAWWQHYLRSVMTQASRPWFTATAASSEEPGSGPALATMRAALGLPDCGTTLDDIVQGVHDTVRTNAEACALITQLLAATKSLCSMACVTRRDAPDVYELIERAGAFVFSSEGGTR